MKRLSRVGIAQMLIMLIGVTILGTLLNGCATMSLTRQDVVRQYSTVAQLSDGLEDTCGRDGALLAPNLFAETQKNLDQAFKFARKADKTQANKAAQRGLDNLDKLNKMIASNRLEMQEVLDIRFRANLQGANFLFADKSEDADEGFRSTARLLEQGEIGNARKKRSALIELYASLELSALKTGTVAIAEKAVLAAEQADADKCAPKTLQYAREELKLSLSILDADRTRVEESNTHALQATWLANQAREITVLTKYFESQDFSGEDRLLWYQNQLQLVRNALRDDTLPFDQPNAKIIQALRGDALALKSVMEDIRNTNQISQQRALQLESDIETQQHAHEEELQRILRIHESQLAALNSGNATRLNQAKIDAAEQVASLQERLSAQALAQAETQRREHRSRERFAQTQHLFSKEEAEVFQQGNNVLIRLKGFSFKPSKFAVESINYALLNKVVSAINTFPESTVLIIGHTDEIGSDKRNLELSAARAQSVVGFLATVGGIDINRLTAEGRGEEEPVASNETAEGRGKNRRIDLLIVNDSSPKGSFSARKQ